MSNALKYSKSQVDKAGKTFISKTSTLNDKLEALKIINTWRSLHAYPMNSIATNLKKKIGNRRNIIVAQRLKRLITIVNKLERYPSMHLSRMQDLGGCRVILPTLKEAIQFRNSIIKSQTKHNLHNEKNYIKNPNPDTGYRGIHLIYEYKNSKNPQFNGLLIEIQLRTQLQHLWATAVETVGMFTHNNLKFNQGEEIWLKFFKLASEIFATEEEQKRLLTYKKIREHVEIIQSFVNLTEKHGLFNKLYTFGFVNTIFTHTQTTYRSGYYLLRLNVKKQKLEIRYFRETPGSIKKAMECYNNLEKEKNADDDIVLVAAKSINTLKKAYPNYFADIKEFTDKLCKFMANQLKKCQSYIDKYEKNKSFKSLKNKN